MMWMWQCVLSVLVVLMVGCSPTHVFAAVDYDPNAPVTVFTAQATTGRSVVVDVRGYVVAVVSIPTASGTFSFSMQGSTDGGVTWTAPLTCYGLANVAATAVTASGFIRCNITGFNKFSLNMDSCSSCSVTATVTAMAGGAVGSQ